MSGQRALVKRSFCTWHSGDAARGSIAWGKPDENDVSEMCEVFGAYAHSPFAVTPSLIDIRAVESVSVLAFERFVRIVAASRSLWPRRVGKQAILHGGGFADALILGAFKIAADDYEIEVFEDPRAAFAWLGAPDVAPAFAALRDSLVEPADVVRRVRAVLDANDRPLTAEGLAREVHLSVRSLQRHLAVAGTSVRLERVEHIVRRAERLLEGSELDLTAIAAMLGLKSAARLVALFRATRSMTPGAFRRARGATHRTDEHRPAE